MLGALCKSLIFEEKTCMLAVQVQVLILYKKKTKAWTGMEGREGQLRPRRLEGNFQTFRLKYYEAYTRYI
jgi:hypothetical protein